MEIKINREDIANPEEILLLEDLECTIDMMISLSPYICNKCENVFCQECVGNWTKKSSFCPMRCTPFNYSPLDNSILKTQINKIKLFCGNKIDGCNETCLIPEKENHEKTCDYRPIQCDKCKISVPKKLLNQHYSKSCEKMKIKCTMCHENFSLYNFISHLDLCFKNIKNCEFCFQRVLPEAVGVNKYSIKTEKEHLKDCPCKIAFCQTCQMPESSEMIEFTHKHEDQSINRDESLTIQVCNFYKLMNSIDNKFNLNFTAIDNEKECLMKNALELFEFIAKNQDKIIIGIESNIKSLKIEEEKSILKLKAEKIKENKELENELMQLENKIIKTEEEIKNLSWIFKEQKSIMDSKTDLIIKRKTESVNNLLLIYSQLKNMKSMNSHKNDNSANFSSDIRKNLLNETDRNRGFEKSNNIYDDIGNYMLTEEEGEKGIDNNSNIGINNSASSFKSLNSNTNNNLISFQRQNSLLKQNLNCNCFKCGGNTEIKNCLTCKKHVCTSCVGKCCNKSKQEHLNNIYCKDCLQTCYLCGINTQCTECARKCFNKNCNFYFCSVCFDKNKHQQRPENTNCRFYKCESCNTDGSCIMATIYCSTCDIRICRNCLQKDHIKHINFK